jgi:ABC-type Fe3+ transport system substrate-binding protein
MTIRIVFAVLLTAVIGAHASHAQMTNMSPALAKVVADAKAEGTLTMRSTITMFGGPEGAKVAQEGINRMFGTHLTIEWSPGPAYGALAALIYQEMQAGHDSSTDVFTSTAVQLAPYLDKGMFRTVDWVKLMPERITPGIVEAEGRALRRSTAMPGVLYNVKAAAWVKDIKTTADLLKPEHKGKFFTTPFLGGFDVMLAPDVWGVEKTQAYIRKFSKQLGGLAGCEATDRIASGEVPALAVDCSGAAPNRAQYRGKGVLENQIMTDMAQRRFDYLMVPTHAKHPNAAILYILYLVSVEGQQKIMRDFMGDDLYDFPESEVRQHADALAAKGVKFVDVTIGWWLSHPGLDAANIELAKLVREK